MNMDVLRCETVAGVLKELAVFALALHFARTDERQATSLITPSSR
jgi:hypothetical protein